MAIAQTDRTVVAQATVRISGCREGAGCTLSEGSGVIVHPAGIILTAKHVAVPEAEWFRIELAADQRSAPVPRFCARRIGATHEDEEDLAFLRIYAPFTDTYELPCQTETSSVWLLPLPALTISALGLESGTLLVAGYPRAGGRNITFDESAFGGYDDENDVLFKVQKTFGQGYSGGPALVEHNGRYEVVGIVHRRTGELGQVAWFTQVANLDDLRWEWTEGQVWASAISIEVGELEGVAKLRIGMTVYALDLSGREVYLEAYAFDSSGQPWQPEQTPLLTASDGQLLLRTDFRPSAFMYSRPLSILVDEAHLGAPADQLQFHLKMSDADSQQNLWTAPVLFQPQRVAAVVLPTPLAGVATPTVAAAASATPMAVSPTPHARLDCDAGCAE